MKDSARPTRNLGATTLVACAALLAAPASFATLVSGSVTATGSEQPVPRAVVVLVAADGTPGATRSEEDGSYGLVVADGSYTLRVQAPGFVLDERTVEIAGDTTVDAALTPLADAPRPLPTFGLPTQNATLVADPGQSGVFYTGSGFANTIYRTIDAGDSWTAVTRVSEDARGIEGTFQGFQRPAIATSGVAGEVATVSLGANGSTGQVWASRDFGTTWQKVTLPEGRVLEPSGTAILRWVHAPGGADFLVLQPAGHDVTLWVADLSASEPEFTALAPGANPLALGEAQLWDAWLLDGVPALAAVRDDGGQVEVYTWTDQENVSSLARLGNPIALAPAVTMPTFFDGGGETGNVMVLGGVDTGEPYPWPQALALIAKPAADADFDNAFVNVQAVSMETCYLPGTGAIAPNATFEDARALVGVSACPLQADPDDTQSVTLGSASGAIMPAFDADWDGASNRLVLGIAGRGIERAENESGTPPGPMFGEERVIGITAPQVRATVFGPDGPDTLAMALDSAGGKRIIASADGGVSFASVVDAGGYAVDWWRGASGDWLVAGHSGAEAGLLTAVLDWNTEMPPLATPNLPSAGQANLSVDGANSDVRALLGVPGTDTLFVGTFQYPGYMGALFRGSLAGGDFDERVAIPSSDDAHPLATIQDLAYCPAEGSAASVADTLFVATGYLGLVQGGLYAVRDATTAPTPVATPLTALPFADRAVTDVVVDCQTGALTVGAASDPGVFHSSDGGATFDNVHFPDEDGGIPGEDSFQAAAIAANPENPDHIVVMANEADDSFAAGFLFETLDGGETWEAVVDPSAVDDLGRQTAENLLVNDLALPPAVPEEALQAAAPKTHPLAARARRSAPIAISAVTLAPLALGTQAGGAALTLDVGARRSAPGAAQATSASGGNGRVRVQWQAPAEIGSRPITAYTAQCGASGKPTRTASTNSAARQADVTGLARGTRYTCSVRARSVLGLGTASNTVQATTFDAPGAPRSLTAKAQTGAARLSFRAPAATGGSAITRYKATCIAPGKPTRALEQAGTTLTVTRLVAKARYRCSVQAKNALGYGPASSAVNVTPK